MASITTAALSKDSAWTFTPKPYDVPHSYSGVTILDLFFKEAQSRPRAPAACSAQDTLSYSQLDDYSTRLAYHLQGLGIKRESLISCRQNKSVWAIVCLLAILKAGAAFVPVDPSYPQSRVEEIIEQTDAQLIIESGCETMHTSATTLRLAPDFIRSLPKKSSLHLRSISASQLAYVYFTSGSTGKPKGVMIEHRALCTSLLAHGRRMGLCASSMVLQATSYTFDPSMTEIFGTLIFGGCICVPSNHTELVDSINHLRANWAFFTPSVISLISPDQVPTLKTVSVGGEALTQDCVDQWANKVQLFNSYGPTEATIFCLIAEVQPDSSRSNIGYATGCRPWIVDQSNHHRLVGAGEIGELVIEGDILARGYLGDKKKTAEAFLEDAAWASKTGLARRFYKTGDLARFNEDGSISCLGRKDRQIKIRGQRVELGEIESRIKRYCGKSASAVIVDQISRNGQQEAKILAAFVVLDHGVLQKCHGISKCAQDILSSFCKDIQRSLFSELPSYMVPNAFIPLDKLPRNSSGKVDRSALHELAKAELEKRLLESSAPPAASSSAIRITPMQKTLQLHWSRLLSVHTQSLGVESNFIQLGGNSLLAIKLVAGLRKDGVCLTTKDVLQASSLAEMAEAATFVETKDIARSAQRVSQLSSVELIDSAAKQCNVNRGAIQQLHYCTSFQESLAAAMVMRPGSYMAQYVFKLPADVDIELFKSSWVTVYKSFPILRTRFTQLGFQETLQAVVDEQPVWRTTRDLRQLLLEDSQHHMTIGKPLSRFALVYENGQQFFVWTLHHALYDAWSLQICLESVAKLYKAIDLGRNTGMSFENYIEFSRVASKDVRSQAFWSQALKDCCAPQFPRLPTADYKPTHSDKLDIELVIPARPATGITIPTLIRAAWALAVSQYTGSEDVVFGAVMSGRNASVPYVDEMVGPTLATVPVRIPVDPSSTVASFLLNVQKGASDSTPHEHFGLNNISKTCEGAKTACQFQTMLVIQLKPEAEAREQDSLFGDLVEIENRDSHCLALECVWAGDNLIMEARFDESAISAANMERILHLWKHLVLQLAVANDAHLLSAIDMVSSKDKSSLSLWNSPEPAPVSGLAHDRIAFWARQHPNNPAVCSWDGALTYAELDDLSSRLAKFLVELNPGTVICLHLIKGLPLIISIVAIMKSGRAFLPLDIDAPPERIQSILSQLEQPLVLASNTEMFHTTAKASAITMSLPLIRALPLFEASWKLPKVGRRDLAYLIMTSGSTGKPKGVMIEHRSLITSIEYHGRFYGLHTGSRVLQFASIAFDAAVGDVVASFVHGACLVVPNQATRMERLVEFINEKKVTWSFFTPSTLRLFQPSDVPTLETIVVGGEAIAPEMAKLWAGSLHLINGYGPSETTIACTAASVARDGSNQGSIGRGLGCLTWIVDPKDHDRLVPIGAVGELVIQGEIVGRGYLNEPEKTSEVFISNPKWAQTSTQECGRMYKTGDLVRYDDVGCLIYIGRKDNQVKLRGQRLELGEVEHHLETSASGRHGLCFVPKQGPLANRLVAVVGPDSLVPSASFHAEVENSETICDLARNTKENLARALPRYMVPDCLTILKHMPVTTSGKLDRKVIAAWIAGLTKDEAALFSTGDDIKDAPKPATTRMEVLLQEVWASVLGLSPTKVGTNRSFHSLGGDSITAMQALARSRNLGFEFTVKDVLQGHTIETLALSARQIEISSETLKEETTERAFALSPIQQVYAMLAPPQHKHHFNQSIQVKLAKVISISQLRQSLEAVVTRHSMLRAKFDLSNPKLATQKISRSTENAFQALESTLSHPGDLLDLVQTSQRSLDITKGPIIRADLISGLEGTQTLFMVAHHLVVDIVSWRLILEDLEAVLSGKVLSSLPPLPFQTWCEDKVSHTVSDCHLPPTNYAYWDIDRDNLTYEDSRRAGFVLDRDLTNLCLGSSHDSLRTKPADLFIAALALSFKKTFNDRQTPVICVEGHGREARAAGLDPSSTVGWFTNIVPVQVDVHADHDPVDLVRRIKDSKISAEKDYMDFFAAQLSSKDVAIDVPELTFNFTGVQQQSNNDKSLLSVVTNGFDDQYDMSTNMRRFAIFDVDACVKDGQLEFEWLFPRSMRNSDMVSTWISNCKNDLQFLATAMSKSPVCPTISDFPLMSMDYDDLARMEIVLRSKGVSFAGEGSAKAVSIFPASPTQNAILLGQQHHDCYWRPRLVFETEVNGPGDLAVEQLAMAWQMVVSANPILRTIMIADMKTPNSFLNVVLDRYERAVEVGSSAWAENPLNRPRATWQDWEPQHRLTIFQRTAMSATCCLEISHALIDHSSMPMIFDAFSQNYGGLTTKKPVAPFADFVEGLQCLPFAESVQYWNDYLADVQPCRLSTGNSREVAKKEMFSAPVDMAEFSEELLHITQKSGVTLATIFRAAWALVLSEATGKDDILFGYILAGRDAPIDNIEQIVGPILNIAACRLSPAAHSTAKLLEAVQDDLLQSLPHQHHLMTALSNKFPESMSSSSAWFDSVVNFRRHSKESTSSSPLSFAERPSEDPFEYPIVLEVDHYEGSGVVASLSCWIDKVSVEAAGQLSKSLSSATRRILEGIISR